MNVKIKTEEGVKMPFKKHDSDFCYDLYATSCEEIAPKVYKYDLGIKCQLTKEDAERVEKDNYLFGLSIRPRSSVWKTGMVLSNCIGTIDRDYTGTISAVFYHVFDNMPKYEVGDRICQIHADLQPKLVFEIVNELDDTDRGEGGYGSTGK